MTFTIRRWGVGHLLGAAAAYWGALAGVTLAPFIKIVWALSRLPGDRGTVSLTMGDAGVTLTAMRDGVSAWSGGAPVSHVALWIAGPARNGWQQQAPPTSAPLRVERRHEQGG